MREWPAVKLEPMLPCMWHHENRVSMLEEERSCPRGAKGNDVHDQGAMVIGKIRVLVQPVPTGHERTALPGKEGGSGLCLVAEPCYDVLLLQCG